MGLGSDLMRFYAKDSGNRDTPLQAFHLAYQSEHPSPAVNLRAANRLCDAGRLYHGEIATGHAVLTARFSCMRTEAELREDIDYGVFDFIVDGFPAVRQRFSESVFQLEVVKQNGDPDHGSAFALLPGVLITARHCVEGMRKVTIVSDSLGALGEPIAVIPDDLGSDVAALVFHLPKPPLSFRVRSAEPLDRVMTMGFPGLRGAQPTLTTSTGEVAGRTSSYLDKQEYWVTTCAMSGGSSGGPVVGADGYVVGVVSSFPASDAGADAHGFGFMVPCDDAVRRLSAVIGSKDWAP